MIRKVFPSLCGTGFLTVLVNFLVAVAGTTRAQSCGPRVSPRLLMEIPCDMTKSSYCSVPGSAYPWHSVRRYIYENQGLMKRMYGDQRHSLILQNEIENRRAKYDFNFFDRGETGRSFFERAETLTSASPTTTNSPTINPNHYYSPLLHSDTSLPVNTQITGNADSTAKYSEDTVGGNIGSLDNVFLTTTPSDSTVTGFQETSAGTLQEAAPYTTTPYASQATTVSSSGPATTSNAANGQDAVSTGTIFQEHVQNTATTSSSTSATTVPRETSTDTNSQSPDAHPKVNVVSLNTLDKEQDEKPQPTEIPRRGMNACPVKEEVIAPYWANNTRGETLALLNVYPFEQYVHWEKCAYENHQMFCRDGCRCEQQYRLHRMLAFDPKNECRGIFADWFRFPSCCVCICYNIPEEVERLFQRGNYRRGRNS